MNAATVTVNAALEITILNKRPNPTKNLYTLQPLEIYMKRIISRLPYLLILLLILFMIGCTSNTEKKMPVPVTGSSIQDLKETACTSADNAGTCTTRLPELGFVTKEDCCELFNKCCK
jgi:hypothetical protein